MFSRANIAGVGREIIMTKWYEPGGEIPGHLGEVVDLYARVRDLRLELEKEISPIRKRESELREHLINNIDRSKSKGAVGKRYRAVINEKTKPSVEDWQKVYEFIKENNSFNILQRRLNDQAISELWEEGVEVPGVGKVIIPTLSIRKLK